MIRRPPRSTPFPTRRSSDLIHAAFEALGGRIERVLLGQAVRSASEPERNRQRLVEEIADRSEEHTSELQSRLHLVCRLLLEKKKNNNNHHLSNQRRKLPTRI